MATIPKNIDTIVHQYLLDLSLEIPIEKAILFGSYAKGTYDDESDVDIAIFSCFFENISRVEGIKYLLKKARKYREIDLEPISFTNRDYEEKIGLVGEILKYGILLE